jgi:8-oxo-dGTP diphosphatase
MTGGPAAPPGAPDDPATRAKSPAGPHVVVAGLLVRAGRVLLVHRSPQRRWYPDCWDLPGGHVENGEPPAHALRRELHEELGIAVTALGEPFAHLQGTDFRMDLWQLEQWNGEPTNREPAEHDALAWLDDQEMTGLRLADRRLPQLVRAALDLSA